MDDPGAFLRSEPFERAAYVKLLRGAEEANVAWELLEPLSGLSTACTDWYKTLRNFVANKCGGSYFPR